MAKFKEATVLLAKCYSNGKTYGIRVENRGAEGCENWVGNWAFPIDDKNAQHEKYDTTVINGGMAFDNEEYPGCPYCEGRNLVYCTCGKLTCLHEGHPFVCAWCGQKGVVTGEFEGTLQADGDV